jgi:hypothetical protein
VRNSIKKDLNTKKEEEEEEKKKEEERKIKKMKIVGENVDYQQQR